MKNIVSLLAVALFATVFAAGCGKMKTCAEADGKSEKICQTKEGFENNLECTWASGPDATKKDVGSKCTPKAPATTVDDAADKKACEVDIATAATQADCDKAKLTNAKNECKHNATSNKCEIKAKP